MEKNLSPGTFLHPSQPVSPVNPPAKAVFTHTASPYLVKKRPDPLAPRPQPCIMQIDRNRKRRAASRGFSCRAAVSAAPSHAQALSGHAAERPGRTRRLDGSDHPARAGPLRRHHHLGGTVMFQNRVAVVTGSAKGIGKAIAEEFRNAGDQGVRHRHSAQRVLRGETWATRPFSRTLPVRS